MLEQFTDLIAVRIILAGCMMGIGTILDVRKREVNDALWLIFGGISVILIFFEPDLIQALQVIGISMIIAPIVLIFWRLGFFGGADAFALIVLAALTPQITLSEGLITPLTTLTNAAIFSIIPFCWNATSNSIRLLQKKKIFEGFDEPMYRKFIAIFFGYRARRPKHSFAIEKKVGKSKKFHFVLHHAENAQYCSYDDTWVTPGIPFLIYIAGGFLMQIFFGDILFKLFF